MCLTPITALYIPFWLKLYRYAPLLSACGWTLHSILVKSIPNSSIHAMYPSSALHSILVKSILIICNKIIIFIKLYIPFWLNLYEWRPVPVLGSGRLYIPFWLNLYLSFLSMNSKPKLSLHSILVKSIPVMCRKLSCALTALHSILVKSIRGRMPSPERRCVTLHSILVKSIPMSK